MSFQSPVEEVEKFLKKLHSFLNNPNFDVDKDVVTIKKWKQDDEKEYCTPYTLIDLEFDSSDIAATLRELQKENYSETLFDNEDIAPPALFVFGKVLQGKTVYIKLKIKEVDHKFILCLAFHYAKYEMRYPYC